MAYDAARSDHRAQARRRQILDAAEACFRARGFHAATMAEIAAAAGFSVGQIYRFFENKEAVVEAIVGQQMDELADTIAAVESRDGAVAAIRRLLAGGVEKLRQPGVPALLLEVTAEAARNPRIAAVVREHDRRIRGAIAELLAKAQGLESVEPTGCPFGPEMLCLVLEGLAARLIRNPELDGETVRVLPDRLLNKLLGPTTPERRRSDRPAGDLST